MSKGFRPQYMDGSPICAEYRGSTPPVTQSGSRSEYHKATKARALVPDCGLTQYPLVRDGTFEQQLESKHQLDSTAVDPSDCQGIQDS
jgi:hypothetical protein